MILRKLDKTIRQRLFKGKAIVLLGPRQTGKTTLIKEIVEEKGNFILLDCDDPFVRSELQKANTEDIRRLIGTNQLIFIDEAQRVNNIGLVMKIITDRFKSVQLLASGSSYLDLLSEISEPLTGRKWEYFLYPISWSEYYDYAGHLVALQNLEARIVFGMYPDVINHPGDEREILRNLAGSLLYKDLLSYHGVRKPDLPENLLRALALQIGNEVSFNELALTLQVDKKTVMTYIDLLEKSFLIFRLQSFSRNLRNEISTGRKIYFYDTGIRNALVNNFNNLDIRQDSGALWENFLVSERMKKLHYDGIAANRFFWRTTAQNEIDYIEEKDGKLNAFEFKLRKPKSQRFPFSFSKAYPESKTELINRENFLDFVL